MKKVLALLFIIVACGLIVTKFVPDSSVSAQKNGETKGTVSDADLRMAEEISRVTNRSSEGLVSKIGPDGVKVDLEERFQNLMMARLEDDGSAAAACVTSLGEANAFLGRDLQTGERIPKTVIDRSSSHHEMSPEEEAFYKTLIAEAREKLVQRPEAATITIVNNDAAGEGFNDPAAPFVVNEGGNNGATRGAQRLNVFNQAGAIWGAFLDSNIPTTVGAQFNPLTCTPTSATLGQAGAAWVNRDFPGAIFTGTWYHGALVNKLSNSDGSTNEINATFNSNLDNACFGGSSRFYYGFDGNAPGGTTDLLVVVLHELGHGLGFSSFVNNSGTNTGQLFLGFPDVYTRFMLDQETGLYWHQMTDAQRVTSATNTGDVFWDGPNVRIASSNLTAGRDTATGRVQLHTPTTFSAGSSVSHFAPAASPNLLMEPNINAGLPITGDLARQQMRDIGWFRDTTGDQATDTITGVTPNGGAAVIGATRTITWTNNGGFNRNVRIELSTDGGATFPTTITASTANTGSFAWTVPNSPTTTARIRVREADFANPSGISSANFTISLTPLAADAEISGRVVDANGRAVTRATVVLTGSDGFVRTSMTNAFGYFVLTGIPVGESYVASVRSKRYRFEPQIVSITDNFTGLDFVAAY